MRSHYTIDQVKVSLLRKVSRSYTFMHALLIAYFSRRNEQGWTGTADLTI